MVVDLLCFSLQDLRRARAQRFFLVRGGTVVEEILSDVHVQPAPGSFDFVRLAPHFAQDDND